MSVVTKFKVSCSFEPDEENKILIRRRAYLEIKRIVTKLSERFFFWLKNYNRAQQELKESKFSKQQKVPDCEIVKKRKSPKKQSKWGFVNPVKDKR